MQHLAMRTARQVLLLCVLAAPMAVASGHDGPRYRWELDEETQGLAIYTSEAAGHGYDVYRVTTTVRASTPALLEILQRFDDYPRWYYRCLETRVLERPARDGEHAGSFVLFFLQDTPHVSNRWAVLQSSVRAGPGRSVVVEFRSLDDRVYRAAPRGGVRMRIHGAWRLTPLGAAETRVAFVLDVDPQVSAPSFLVDPHLRDVAVETVRSLRRIVASGNRGSTSGRASAAETPVAELR